MNPYKQIPGLYDLGRVDLYSKHHLGELPPHIFAVANECYRCIWKRHDSQCVLIRSVSNMMEQVLMITFMEERGINPLFVSEIHWVRKRKNNKLAAVWGD